MLDGPDVVHMLPPGASKTFHDYAEDMFMPFMPYSQLQSVNRVDVVWDRYLPASLKQAVRDVGHRSVSM